MAAIGKNGTEVIGLMREKVAPFEEGFTKEKRIRYERVTESYRSNGWILKKTKTVVYDTDLHIEFSIDDGWKRSGKWNMDILNGGVWLRKFKYRVELFRDTGHEVALFVTAALRDCVPVGELEPEESVAAMK